MRAFSWLLLASLAASVQAAEPSALKLVRAIALPGVQGRFDHFAIDVKGQRVFVAALGNNTLEVLDLAAGKRLQSITGLHKPTGVLYLAEFNRLYVANGDDGTLKVFDGATYKLVTTLGALDDADNVRFDATTKLIYVGYGSGALGVTDPAAAKLAASVKLAAHPESFQLETQGHRIFVNAPDANQVAVIDREKRAVIATWPMKNFKANFPMALDEASHRLFLGCRQPARLVIVDTADGRIVFDLAISGDTDDLFYDAARRRLYISCGEGFLDVIEQRDADAYKLREKIPTASGARTCLFSSERNELYLAVPRRGTQTAEVRIFSVQ